MSLPAIIRKIDRVDRVVAGLRPTRSAGVLTSHTPRGVIRRAITFSSNQTNNETTSAGPRWQ